MNEDLLGASKKVARSQPKKRKSVRLPVFRPARPGTWPGVNLDSNAALLARMEGL